MKTIVHKGNTRGYANYGWLDTHYTFSFADYYDLNRIHFGALRVLNDDLIAGGGGFGRHPHDNMEIVTIVLEGELEHKDSMENTVVIHRDEIQVMSAGTGVFHSEYNKDPKVPISLLQIWVYPRKKNIQPRYDQKVFDPVNRKNKWQRIVSPEGQDTLHINQDAYFSLITLDKDFSSEYFLTDPEHGLYVFVIDGSINIEGIPLEKRDGAGFSELISLSILAERKSEILLIEIPMRF